MKKLLVLLIALFISAPLFAQTDTTETIYIPDRPGYTYNAHLVGLHQMDIEMGFGYNYMNNVSYINNGAKTNIFYNTNYIRYGAFKWLEFRYGVEFGSMTPDSIGGYSTTSGVRGVNVGFKIPILVDKKWAPDIAIVATTYLPNLGKPCFAYTNYAPSVNLALQKCFFDRLVLFGNAGFWYDGFSQINTNTINYNASLAAYFFITQKFAIFAETMVMYNDRTSPNNMFDGGCVYYITDNIQWDLSFGANYVSGLDNSFINSGISWRIPKHLFAKTK